jgi:hypothetical protein
VQGYTDAEIELALEQSEQDNARFTSLSASLGRRRVDAIDHMKFWRAYSRSSSSNETISP